jgi:acyl carrier protein
MSEITHELVSFLSDQLHSQQKLTGETDLIEQQLLDSLLIMDVISFVEGRFRVRLGPADVSPSNFQTLSRLAGLVGERMRVA